MRSIGKLHRGMNAGKVNDGALRDVEMEAKGIRLERPADLNLIARCDSRRGTKCKNRFDI